MQVINAKAVAVDAKRKGLMNMTPHQAEFVFEVANWFLVAALLVGLVATYFIFSTTRIKEADAQEKTKIATEHAASATREATVANAEAAKANERAASLELKAATLTNDANKARLDLEKLKATTSWRELTPIQIESITKKLRTRKPEKISLSWFSGDPEAQAYAAQFEFILKNVGVTVEEQPWLAMDKVPTGILISGNNENTDASSLIEALKSAGLEVTPHNLQSNVQLWIGTKSRGK